MEVKENKVTQIIRMVEINACFLFHAIFLSSAINVILSAIIIDKIFIKSYQQKGHYLMTLRE